MLLLLICFILFSLMARTGLSIFSFSLFSSFLLRYDTWSGLVRILVKGNYIGSWIQLYTQINKTESNVMLSFSVMSLFPCF